MHTDRCISTFGLLCTIACARPASAQTPSRLSTLSGRVLVDSLELPIVGAKLSIPALYLSAISDSLGRFRLTGIEPGRQVVTVVREGFETLRTSLAFAIADSVDADILLTRIAPGAAQRIAKVDVTANAIPRGLEDFERRRRAGIGDFIMGDVIVKNANGLFGEAIRRIPGVVLTRPQSGFGAYASAGRGASRGRACFVAVMIDRSWVYEGKRGELPFDLNSISPETIAAVEYYRGASFIPAELEKERNTCGVLVVWTKRG